jgi:pimeloyl-ACP methyl ester carboxylesterase
MLPEVISQSANDTSEIHYEELGTSGPTLVFLHGWMHSRQDLRPLAELLSEEYKVILLDLPGFGTSPLPHGASDEGGGWSTGDYAGALHTLLMKLQIERCSLIGHSLGGRISVRYAAAHPEVVHALVLSAHPAYHTPVPLKIFCARALLSCWLA